MTACTDVGGLDLKHQCLGFGRGDARWCGSDVSHSQVVKRTSSSHGYQTLKRELLYERGTGRTGDVPDYVPVLAITPSPRLDDVELTLRAPLRTLLGSLRGLTCARLVICYTMGSNPPGTLGQGRENSRGTPRA